ncbi:DUF4304 domain-containing protein [Lysobacter soli]|uniref:DUF4304 domain-containing protein n=1 Tax=Lysobacter soli TaxID=453783 RepID=UPI003CE4CCAB
MASSITQDCIRQVSTYVAEAFKPDGFRRQAPHLWRERGDVINVINFQASQWGSAKAGRFTINLASTNRHLYSTWTGRKFPANPAAAIWPVHIRIGALTSGTDLWWDVEESTNAYAGRVHRRFVPQGHPHMVRNIPIVGCARCGAFELPKVW